MIKLLYLGVIIMALGSVLIGCSYLMVDKEKYSKIERLFMLIGVPALSLGWILMIVYAVMMFCYG